MLICRIIPCIIMHICIAACTGKNRAVESKSSLDEVKKKRDFYLAEGDKIKDKYGWLPHSCDALLYNSLAAYSGSNIDIYKAEESPGRWRRHPDFDWCRPGNGSKSTISKDMYRGLLLYLWQKQDGPALARINHYGDGHKWVMGESEDEESYYGRVFFLGSPILVLQIKEMNRELNQNPLRNMMASGVVLSLSEDGFVILRRSYEAHLHVLRIYLRYLINGSIQDYEKLILQEYARFQPRNALFEILHRKFTDGNYDRAISLLMDEKYFPNDRLPGSSERCADYLWASEENEGDEYHPCAENKTHPGIDFLFAVKLMEE